MQLIPLPEGPLHVHVDLHVLYTFTDVIEVKSDPIYCRQKDRIQKQTLYNAAKQASHSKRHS